MTTAAHYRLTSDGFLSINSQLTNAQLRVYMYYKTLDPFGDRKIEIRTEAIAEILGFTQRTVQLALNKLSSMGMIIWEKSKSFVTRSVDRLDEMKIAKAKSRSSRRSVDRERQLELNLEADSTTSHTSSSLFKLDQLDRDDEILNNEQDEDFGSIDDNNEISVEDAIAEIRKALDDNPQATADNPHDEDLHLSNDYEQPQDFEEILEQKTDLQLSTVGNANGIADGKPSRAAVEEFVLKTLNKSFPSAARRAAYFAKFDSKSWKKWETDYKASLIPQAPYKRYLPEKVEVAAPDFALRAIAQIKAKLGVKS
jgi:Mn-dependent DtxR family transcriptional regulator